MAEPVHNEGFDGCVWPIDEGCLSDDWNEFDVEVQDRSMALAGATLRRLTGYRVGGCAKTIRPCGYHSCVPSPWQNAYSFYPVLWAGRWSNVGSCACEVACSVALPPPVGEVYEVKVDGVLLPEVDYRVERNVLIYQGGGECPFPVSQNLSLPDTEPGTFSIRYLNSYPVDGMGAYAAGVLANEFAQACMGNACRLPNGVTTVVRQGITLEITSGAFPDGLTGIHEVDTYLALWNPDGIRQDTQIWTPEMNRY